MADAVMIRYPKICLTIGTHDNQIDTYDIPVDTKGNCVISDTSCTVKCKRCGLTIQPKFRKISIKSYITRADCTTGTPATYNHQVPIPIDDHQEKLINCNRTHSESYVPVGSETLEVSNWYAGTYTFSEKEWYSVNELAEYCGQIVARKHTCATCGKSHTDAADVSFPQNLLWGSWKKLTRDEYAEHEWLCAEIPYQTTYATLLSGEVVCIPIDDSEKLTVSDYQNKSFLYRHAVWNSNLKEYETCPNVHSGPVVTAGVIHYTDGIPYFGCGVIGTADQVIGTPLRCSHPNYTPSDITFTDYPNSSKVIESFTCDDCGSRVFKKGARLYGNSIKTVNGHDVVITDTLYVRGL